MAAAAIVHISNDYGLVLNLPALDNNQSHSPTPDVEEIDSRRVWANREGKRMDGGPMTRCGREELEQHQFPAFSGSVFTVRESCFWRTNILLSAKQQIM